MAPATPANTATVEPAASPMTRSVALIGHHPNHARSPVQNQVKAKRSPRSPAFVLSTTVPLFVVPPAGFEPAPLPPEGSALSPERRGLSDPETVPGSPGVSPRGYERADRGGFGWPGGPKPPRTIKITGWAA